MLRPVCALLVALTSLAGCSLAFVHGPPANADRLPYFDCSTGNTLPVLDAVFAGIAALDAVGAATGSQAFRSPQSETAVFAGAAALTGASAIYGFKKTSDCRQAQELMLKRAASQPTMPAFAPPPRLPPRPAAVDPWTGRPLVPPAPAH